MLSNTALPKYYTEFRNKVLRGEEPVNEYISLEMNRIDSLVADPNIYYDGDVVDGWARFCEKEMTLTDGSEVELLDSFKLWGEQIFGWYYFVERDIWVPNPNGGGRFEKRLIKKRLITKQYLIVARGAAKTMYSSFVQAYFLVIDPETTNQIATAPTMRQAEEILSPIRTAIAVSRGPVFKFLTEGSIQNTTGNRKDRVKLASTKKGVQMFLTNSILEVYPMAVNKLQGLRPKISSVDEWLSGDTREDPISAIEQGASKLKDYLILCTSSEGNVRNGIGDSIKMELLSILHGEYENSHTSIFYYRLDNVDEVPYPELWKKANPNIGLTVDYDIYQLDVERAEKAPATRNDILAKRFGLPLEGYTYYFTYEETLRGPAANYDGMPCALGADLSQGNDFCAFTFLFPLMNEFFGVKTICFITTLTYSKLPSAMREKYDEFIAEGSLMVLEGAILDMFDIYDIIINYIEEHDYDVRAFGYDPYNATQFVERWVTDHGEWAVFKVPQGVRTESVPLGEIKSLVESRKILHDQEMMTYTMGNAIVIIDNNGNRKLLKRKSEEKIDSVAAEMDAFVAYKAIGKDGFE